MYVYHAGFMNDLRIGGKSGPWEMDSAKKVGGKEKKEKVVS